MEEVKVLTTGVSAEYGHSAGGSLKMDSKSGSKAWGRFTGVVGDFSNYGTAQANVQASLRVEF